jgi:hypothetical protein
MRKVMLVALSLIAPADAWAAEPFARASVENENGIVPGQQVRVDVDILVSDFFTSPPQFPLFDVPNALVTLPEERADNLTQTVDGVTYSGIRRAYAVVPQVAGTFVIPEIDVELGYAVDGKRTKATVKVPSVSFTATAPASATGGATSFAANDLAIEQSFDRDIHSLKVGDAVVRTIVVTAKDTQAMIMPPVAVGTAPGLHQYAKAPKIEDGISIGRATASRRTETYVYTADKDGSFVIPVVAYPWFDVAHHEAKTSSLPSIQVTVAAAVSETAIKPMLEKAKVASPWVHRKIVAAYILAALALLGLAWIGREFPAAIISKFCDARMGRLASRGHRLKMLQQTIRTGNEREIYSGLHVWSRSLGYRTLDEWACDGSDDLRHRVELLSRRLFHSGQQELDRNKLKAEVDFRPAVTSHTSSALPPLNPTAAGSVIEL